MGLGELLDLPLNLCLEACLALARSAENAQVQASREGGREERGTVRGGGRREDA